MSKINKPAQPLIPPASTEDVEALIAADTTHAPLVNDLVPAENLPSYVDDVVEFADVAHFPVEGEEGKIYVALDTDETYRWSGSTYIQIGGKGDAGDGLIHIPDTINIDSSLQDIINLNIGIEMPGSFSINRYEIYFDGSILPFGQKGKASLEIANYGNLTINVVYPTFFNSNGGFYYKQVGRSVDIAFSEYSLGTEQIFSSGTKLYKHTINVNSATIVVINKDSNGFRTTYENGAYKINGSNPADWLLNNSVKCTIEGLPVYDVNGSGDSPLILTYMSYSNVGDAPKYQQSFVNIQDPSMSIISSDETISL